MAPAVLGQQPPGQPPQAPQRRQVFPGQAPPPATGFGGKQETFRKFNLVVFDQYSYRSHPFFQITGAPEFEDSDAGNGGSGIVGSPESDVDANFFQKALHVLPPFGWEYGWKFDLQFPQSISLGFDYIKIGQLDQDAIVALPPISVPTLPRFEMDTYYYAFSVRFYGLPGNMPGINYFAGFSLGVINGDILVRSVNPTITPDEIIHFSKSPVGAARLGIESSGANFGMRYEMMIINARNVDIGTNPFPLASGEAEKVTLIDFSGTLIRISGYWKF